MNFKFRFNPVCLRRGIVPRIAAFLLLASCSSAAGVLSDSTESTAGSLQLSTISLPAGASAIITVIGADGIHHDLTGAGMLASLPAGSYTITASDIIVGGERYSPIPAIQTIQISGTITATPAAITYQHNVTPTNGSVSLTVSGLPALVGGNITLAGPGGSSQTLAGTQDIASLAPGSYVVTASDVVVGTDTYRAQPTVQTLTVTAGNAAVATVTYAIVVTPPIPSATGSLTVAVTGLPAGAAANINVTGPGAFSTALGNSASLTALEPGSYTVVAADLVIAGTTYAAQPATQSVGVTSGNTATAVVTFTARAPEAPATGALNISTGGLPLGAAANVTVTGPGGFSQALNGSQLLNAVIPGAYTISAVSVTAGIFAFAPTVASQTVTVSSNNVASATVLYAPADGDLVVTIGGLSASTAASVSVSGPGGFSRLLTASQTLNALAPGSYTITATSIWDNGFTYAAAPATQLQNVSAGGSASASVAYAPSTANLTVAISGLPAGAIGNVNVAGPSGFSQDLNSTQTLSGIVAGTYAIAAAAVTFGGAVYAPAVATQSRSLVAGSATSVSVSYSMVVAPPPTAGNAIVSIAGLAAGANASVVVTGPGAFSQLLTGTQTLSNLAPGSYTVTAASISNAGTTYTASPATQPLNVIAGATATASVAYTPVAPPPPTTGNATITINGVPSGANASVIVTGPGSYSHALTGTQTLSGIAPGSYTVTASAIAANGFTYSPSASTQSLTVASGGTASATVTYAATSGALSVTVSGLPSGVASDVTVTGPASFSQALAGSQTLASLVTGSYAIAAASVSTGGYTYAPSVTSQTKSVSGGATANASVTYAVLPSPLTVTISGLPAGVAGSATVTGPGNYNQLVTSSITMGGMSAGSYTVTAANIISGGVTYAPAAVTQTATVASSTSPTVTVAYAAVAAPTGSLAVTIGGLPAGVNGSVTVTGPASFSQALTATQTLSGLTVGSYTIAAANVTSAGTTYAPSTSSQSKAVTGSATTTVTVSYAAVAPTTGSLAVTMSGLPAGVNGGVTVTGPASFSQALTATQTLSGLTVGSYTIAAANVTSAGTTYAPSTSSQIKAVTGGATTTVSVSYAAVAPTTGSLAVTLSGLPAGVNGSVTVTGPASFSQALPTTQTISSLAPGTYTIAAANVISGGTTYAPTPTSQTKPVTAGTTATVTVTYAAVAPTTGSLAVTVSGLPAGATAGVTVTGPASYSHAVTATQTLSSLTAGTYTIAAANVISGGTTYAPTPTSQTKAVTAGNTVSATVTYAAVAPLTGSLGVTVTGLPAGASGNVTVTSLLGFSQALTATQTLTSLLIATYTVTAQNVTIGGVTYTPQVASQTALVIAGITVSATVSYAAPSGLPAMTPGLHARTFTVKDPTNGNANLTLKYQLYIPQGYTPSRSWPVILSNHGSGERGTDNQKQLGVGLGAHIAAVGEQAIIVFPQEPVTSGGTLAVFQLLYNVEKGALDEALTAVNADLTRIYLTGNSAGAIRGWAQVYQQPTRFAAFFPASGEAYGEEILNNTSATSAAGVTALLSRVGSLPIHVYHGSVDGTVDVAEDRALAAAFNAAGHSSTFTYTEYAGYGHGDTWDRAFSDPALWTWVFAQHR